MRIKTSVVPPYMEGKLTVGKEYKVQEGTETFDVFGMPLSGYIEMDDGQPRLICIPHCSFIGNKSWTVIDSNITPIGGNAK